MGPALNQPGPGYRIADLRAFNLHVGSMGSERLQISNVRSQDGSSRLSACHNKRVDSGPAPSKSPQKSCAPSAHLRNFFDDLACLQEPVGVCIPTGVSLKAFCENDRRDLRRPQALVTDRAFSKGLSVGSSKGQMEASAQVYTGCRVVSIRDAHRKLPPVGSTPLIAHHYPQRNLSTGGYHIWRRVAVVQGFGGRCGRHGIG